MNIKGQVETNVNFMPIFFRLIYALLVSMKSNHPKLHISVG